MPRVRLGSLSAAIGTAIFVILCALLIGVLFEGWLVVIFGQRHLNAKGAVVVDPATWPKTVKTAFYVTLTALTAAKLTVDRAWGRLRTRADLALLVLAGVLLLAGIFGPSEPKVIVEALFVYFRGAIVFYALRALNPSPARIRRMLWILGALLAVQTSVALVQFIVGTPAYQAVGWADLNWAKIGRAQALLDHPNDLGHFAGLMLLGLFALFASRERVSARWWVAVVLVAVAMGAAQSRESTVATLAGLVLIAVLRRAHWKRFAVLASLIVLAAALPIVASQANRAEWVRRAAGVTEALAVPSGQECIQGATDPDQACSVKDREIRLLYYQQGARLLARRPVLGYGIGHFGGIVAYQNNPNWSDDPRFQPVGFNRYNFDAKTVDAFWLHLVIEAGVLGVIAYVAWLWLLVAPFVRPLLRRADPGRRARAPGHPAYYWAPAAVLFVMLVALLSGSFEDPMVPPVLFTIVGIGWVVLAQNSERSTQRRPEPASVTPGDGSRTEHTP
jgi:O-antigen ligase